LRQHRDVEEEDGLRLVSCRDDCCRLEVQHDGRWGSICTNGFSDLNAYVACRQLGYSGGRMRMNFGGGDTAPWLDNVHCTATSNRLQECAHNNWGSVNCGHTQDVGVCCTH